METRTKPDYFETKGKDGAVNYILSEDDFWSIVGVNTDADEVTKRKAYVKRCLLVHPDQNPSQMAKEAFQKLQNAYEKIKRGNMKILEDSEIQVAEKDGVFGMVAPDNQIQLIPINDEKEVKTVSQAEWEAIKMKNAVERLKERKGGFEPPPFEVRLGYEEATPSVLQLLKDPDNEEAEARIKTINAKIEGISTNYRIDPGLIKKSAQEAIEFKKKINDDPSARKSYQATSLILQKHGEMFGWPEEWRLESIPENGGEVEDFFGKAQIYVGVLKQNPDDQEAINKLQELNHQQMQRIQNGENMDTDGTSQTVAYEELAKYYREWNGSIASFKRNRNPSDLEAAQILNGSLKEFLSSHGYPQAWSMELPSDLEMGADTRKLLAPTTRLGHPILAYSEKGAFGTKKAYLFAVLNEGSSPIGSLISGTEIGHDTKTKYLAYALKREKQSYQRQVYQSPTVHYVFVRHNTIREETWVIFSPAADRNRIAMTISDYEKLRKGCDAFYDVQILCRDKNVPLPSSMQKKLNKRGISGIGSLGAPTTHLLQSADDWNKRNITVHDLLRPRRRDESAGRQETEGSERDREEALIRHLVGELRLGNRAS